MLVHVVTSFKYPLSPSMGVHPIFPDSVLSFCAIREVEKDPRLCQLWVCNTVIRILQFRGLLVINCNGKYESALDVSSSPFITLLSLHSSPHPSNPHSSNTSCLIPIRPLPQISKIPRPAPPLSIVDLPHNLA